MVDWFASIGQSLHRGIDHTMSGLVAKSRWVRTPVIVERMSASNRSRTSQALSLQGLEEGAQERRGSYFPCLFFALEQWSLQYLLSPAIRGFPQVLIN